MIHRLTGWVLVLAGLPIAGLPQGEVPRDVRPADPPQYQIPPGEVPERVLTAADLPGETRDWAIGDLRIPDAWTRTQGQGQVVAVLDTGVMLGHRDLRGQIIHAQDFTGSGVTDRNGHGTWCVGAIVAADNGWGMIGAAPRSRAWVGKVLNDQGSGSVVGIAAGIRAAADWVGPAGERVSVVSLSLGGPSRDVYLPPALEYARSRGLIVVAAAGNDGPRENSVGYPGGYPGVICVAAHDRTGQTAIFSSRGPGVFCTGPGVSTRAPYPGPGDGQFATISGTSMATPYLAAVALLWCAAHPEISTVDRPTRFEQWLRSACDSPERRTPTRGYGKPNAGLLTKPDPTPDDPTRTVTLTEADLTPEARTRLKAARIERFSFTVTSQSWDPTLTYDELYRRVLTGDSLDVAIGVPAPIGYRRVVPATVPIGVRPGLYHCTAENGHPVWLRVETEKSGTRCPVGGRWVAGDQ